MSETPRRTALHVYNQRCALTVEPSRNRAGTAHTVNMETAAKADGGKEFRWDAKLVVQVTAAELADVLAAFLGHVSSVEFLHHGPRRDKGYRLFHDGARLVVQVFTAGERHTVGLERADRLAVSAMLFRQLQRNHGGLAADVLYAMLERIYAGSVPRAHPPATAARLPGDVPPPSTTERTPTIAPTDRHASSRTTAPRDDPGPGPDPYDW